MRILHFAGDHRFIVLIQDLFEEAFPGSNVFRILHNPAKAFTFVKAGPHLSAVSRAYFHRPEVIRDFANCDCLVIHSMDPTFARALLSAPKRVMVVWIGWGYDYYYLLRSQLGTLVLEQTAVAAKRAMRRDNLLALLQPWRPITFMQTLGKSVLPSLHWPIILNGLDPRKALSIAAKRIDIFSVNPFEVAMVRRALPSLKGMHHPIHYNTKEDILDVGPERVAGRDILLGNSATPENNHFEALHLLKALGVDDRRILTPLSYGSPTYADEVCKVGYTLFKDAFSPLRNIMSLSDFGHAWETCEYVIMNHVRQQAFGTIAAALFRGAKVFMRAESPLFPYLRGLGLVISTIDSLEKPVDRPLSPLSVQDKERNRRIIGSELARSRVVESIRVLEAFHRERLQISPQKR